MDAFTHEIEFITRINENNHENKRGEIGKKMKNFGKKIKGHALAIDKMIEISLCQ